MTLRHHNEPASCCDITMLYSILQRVNGARQGIPRMMNAIPALEEPTPTPISQRVLNVSHVQKGQQLLMTDLGAQKTAVNVRSHTIRDNEHFYYLVN